MPWLGFANHFPSNQRLHAWSWINRTFSWEWFVFLVGNLALSVFGLFLFYFCLVWGKQVTNAQDFGWQSKGEDHFRSWFLFLFYLVTILFCSDIVWSKDLSVYFFLFSFDLWSRIFLFFLLSSNLDWEFSFLCFLPRARMDILILGQGFMVSWDFGSRLVERLDMIYVRFWPAVWG